MSQSRISKIVVSIIVGLFIFGCSTDKAKNQAKEAAARYWSDKAYPGKSYDIQVTEAEKTSDGQYRVKGIVDGETRVGTFDPNSETFSEGYYSLAHEREKRIAELEQESKYWKEKSEGYEKEIYKLNVQLSSLRGDKAPPAPQAAAAPAASADKQ